MSKSIVFVANGFTKENIRLQPWRYVFEIACARAQENNVVVITEGGDVRTETLWQENLSVIQTNYLSVKKQKHLKDLIQSLQPDELWWSTTPRTVAFYPLLSSIECTVIAFMTCPLYSWTELFQSYFAKVPLHQTKVLWTQRFVPRSLFRWLLNKEIIHKVIVQSKKNRKIISDMGVTNDKIKLIPVGIDKEGITLVNQSLTKDLRQHHQEIEDKFVYLYFGALRPIRGFDALINALPLVIEKNPNVHLMILARGANEHEVAELSRLLQHKGLLANVSIVGGWLTKDEICSYIDLSDSAVLPFVLVPSDIPIAVLEAMARGKPVVVSSVDGLPEMVTGRGVIINPLNTKEFAEQLYLLSVDDERREHLGQSAQSYMDAYPSWQDVGDIVEKALK